MKKLGMKKKWKDVLHFSTDKLYIVVKTSKIDQCFFRSIKKARP